MVTPTRRTAKQPLRPKREPIIAIAKMTSKGQITVPKAIREGFDLEPGDEIAFVEDETGTHIRRYFRKDPMENWIGVIKDMKASEVDAYIDEMRGR